jgi:GTP-binding protein
LKIAAEFVTSVADVSTMPGPSLAEVTLVGRSNVGKSSLINALVRQRLARTSAAPGKTRLANVYRVTRGGRPAFYLVDLPGYGFARGGSAGFDELVEGFFAAPPPADEGRAALLLVDARHPGLENDRAAWRWIQTVADHTGVVATKIDKLARGQRIRAMRELESAFEAAVLPVSSVTGEGLDELWKLIDRLANSPKPLRPSPPRATVPPLRKK